MWPFMDFILGCGALALMLGIIVGIGWVGFVFPLKVRNENKRRYNIPGVSVIWAVVQGIFAIGLFYEYIDESAGNLAIVGIGCIAVYGLALYTCVKKCKQVNMSREEIIKTGMAQCCLAIGIFVVVVLLLAASGDKRKKRHNSYWDWF